MGTILVGAEEVLLTPDPGSYAASHPLESGLELVLALTHSPTVRLVVAVGTTDAEQARYWLQMNGLPGAQVLPLLEVDSDRPVWESQWHLIEQERSRGPLTTVVTAYAPVFTKCVLSYQGVVLFGRPGSIGHDQERPTWETLHKRVIEQRRADMLKAVIANPQLEVE